MEVFLFADYPKETRGGLFYTSSDNKFIMSTHVTFFLEENSIYNLKPKSRIIIEELDLTQEQIEPNVFCPIFPLISMHVQRWDNVLKG